MIEEKCENCKHLGVIYQPPSMTYEAIYEPACFLFANDTDSRQVMRMTSTSGMCECFNERGDRK